MWRYYKPEDPAGYGGVQKLIRATKAKPGKVAKWLSSQDAYTLHRPTRRTFQRLTTTAVGLNHYWQADLLDLSNIATHNADHRFLLNVVDVYSRYGWSVPLKNKTGVEVARGFREILNEQNAPIHLHTDQGKEFFNGPVRVLLNQYEVNHFASPSDKKAAIVERWNRTLREKLWRYFTKHNTYTYLTVLPKFIQAYNATPHSFHGLAPKDINLHNENLARDPRKGVFVKWLHYPTPTWIPQRLIST